MYINTNEYFTSFPNESRLWCFMGEKEFSKEDLALINNALQLFIPQWNAHGSGLNADFAIIANQFIIIVADESMVTASGCSIDSLVRYIKSIEKELSYSLTNRMLIGYELFGNIEVAKLNEFKSLVKNNDINKDTLVFNNSISTLKEFKNQWALPLEDSWANVFLK